MPKRTNTDTRLYNAAIFARDTLRATFAPELKRAIASSPESATLRALLESLHSLAGECATRITAALKDRRYSRHQSFDNMPAFSTTKGEGTSL